MRHAALLEERDGAIFLTICGRIHVSHMMLQGLRDALEAAAG
jgi:hypothetical protein